MLSPKDALDAVRQIQAGPRAYEQTRLERIRRALSTRPQDCDPTVELPKDPLPVHRNLARKAATPLLGLVLDTFSQVMKVEGFVPSVEDDGRQWKWWQRNRFDALQVGVNRSAMGYGAAYVVALPGGKDVPAWTPRSALSMTALYADPSVDEWPMMALDVDGSMLKLYDEEGIYFIGNENQPRTTYGTFPTQLVDTAPNYTFIEARRHNAGFCPIVRFRDRHFLYGEEQFGIIEPLLSIQERIDETVFGMLIAQYYAAFKQRYVIGWVPNSEKEALEASASSLWTFGDGKDTVSVGELSETDLTRYIQAKDTGKQDMAAIAQVPPASLGQQGISNVSGATMDGLSTGKDRKAAEMATSLGESYEQLFRGSSHIMGYPDGAADFDAEMRWMRTVDMSMSQATDALSKWVQALGVNDKVARSWLPGWTDQMEAENAKLGPAAQGGADPLQSFLDTVSRQTGSNGNGASSPAGNLAG